MVSCVWGDIMRTNIVLDDDLIREGLKYAKLKTKKDLVYLALKEFVERRKRKNILKLEGKIKWEGSLEDMRSNRFDLS